MTVVGFTGTQEGMAPAQVERVWQLLQELDPCEVHHGDCVGADAEFHRLALALGVPSVVVRPGIQPAGRPSRRAFCEGTVVHEPLAFMARNDLIVASCDVLIAAPPSMQELVRDGAWATWRRAGKAGKERLLVLPDGTLDNS